VIAFLVVSWVVFGALPPGDTHWHNGRR
jgi:hypothetical protein